MESGFMHQLLQQLINGLSLGSIYALIALGYTMIYGILKLINFAHGDIYMVGAYIGYIATTVFHLPFFPSLLIAMAGAALVGMLIERGWLIGRCAMHPALPSSLRPLAYLFSLKTA